MIRYYQPYPDYSTVVKFSFCILMGDFPSKSVSYPATPETRDDPHGCLVKNRSADHHDIGFDGTKIKTLHQDKLPKSVNQPISDS